MKSAPCSLTATEGIRELALKRLSSREWIQSCIDRIAARDPSLHAFVAFDPEVCLRQARDIDEAVAQGRVSGKLLGAPIGVKDVFNTVDYPTRMGSPIWKDFTPGNDARVVHALKSEGGIVVGKTVTAEFAVHYPGPTVNPHNPEYSPGTSSSGSAAAVAAEMVPLALGTQTAGSTIRPASYCGVHGFKPSFGVIPRTGVLKTLDTLDHVAFFARSIDDLQLLFETARVRGPNHPFVHQLVDSTPSSESHRRWRVGLVRGPVWDEAEPYAQAALIEFAAQLATHPDIDVEEAELPAPFRDAHALHERIYEKALSYYFREEYEQHRGEISPMFREMVERGAATSPEEYRVGLARQESLTKELDAFFDDYDIVLNLSTASHAPKGLLGRDMRDCCLIWTLCHVPAISVPVFRSPQGLPFGAQLVARRYNDRRLLDFAYMLQSQGLLTDWRAWPMPRTA